MASNASNTSNTSNASNARNKRNIIYQVKLGNSSLYDWCTESVRQYADRIGVSYFQLNEPTLKICPDPKTSGRSKGSIEKFGCLPIFEKENAFDLLGNYDQVAIIDADIFIREDAPNIFWSLPSSHEFGAVLECEMPITEKYRKKILSYSKGQYSSIVNECSYWNYRIETGYDFHNMGVMVLNSSFRENHLKGMSTEHFLKQTKFKRFIDGVGNWRFSTDQTLLNHFIRKENVKVKNLDWRWNALYKGIEDKRLPEAYFIHFFLKDHLPEKGENIEQLSKSISQQ